MLGFDASSIVNWLPTATVHLLVAVSVQGGLVADGQNEQERWRIGLYSMLLSYCCSFHCCSVSVFCDLCSLLW